MTEDDDEDILLQEIDTNLLLKNLAIFDSQIPDEPIPDGFTAQVVRFDARPASSLNWKEETKQAQDLIARGYKVCFELDLGLFGPDFKGTRHQGQFQTLVLALDEFRTRILEPLREHTAAVILWRSDKVFSTLEERDVSMDYLDLLRLELPDEVITLLLFDCSNLDPYSFARMFSADRYSLFTLALTSAPLLQSCCCWNKGKALQGYIGKTINEHTPQECTKGLIMPRFSTDAQALMPLLERLTAQNEPFKIISEDFLATEWEGLDELYVEEQCLAPTTLRTIAGFAAAGGRINLNSP